MLIDSIMLYRKMFNQTATLKPFQINKSNKKKETFAKYDFLCLVTLLISTSLFFSSKFLPWFSIELKKKKYTKLNNEEKRLS